MSYATGQITSSSTPATALKDEIETLLTAHAAWTKDDSFTASIYTFEVWKSAGASNSFGTDFYVVMEHTSDADRLFFRAMEEFDNTTDQGRRGCPDNDSFSVTELDGTRYGDTYAALTDANQFNPNVYVDMNVTDFNYFIGVSANAITVSTTDSSSPIQAGLFEPLGSDPNEFPLVLMKFGHASQSNASTVSRRYDVIGAGNVTYGFTTKHSSSTTVDYSCWTRTDGQVGGTVNDSALGGPMGARALVSHYSIASSAGFTKRGLCYDVLMFDTAGAVDLGDTITVNADTYVYLGQSTWLDTTVT